jgi:hypothetical protein
MPHSKKRLGMVLTEALVAIATLAMGVIALGTITQNSIGTTILAKDYLVARGLAKEGEEAVKNIRYTNWMLKAANKNCWLRINPNNPVDPNCGTLATAGSYYVATLSGGVWTLAANGSTAPDLDKPTASYTTPFRLYSDSSGYYPAAKTGATLSKFYRSVQPTSITADAATFNIKVQWKDGAKTREINRSLTMYNYL